EANWMPREIPSRPIDIQPDLVRQLERRAELLLASQQLVEVHAHGIAVDIGIEVEDVALDRDPVVLVQGRPDTDIRHTPETAIEALEARCGDIDAAAREELIRRIDVDGGHADLASEAAASGDAAVDEVGAAESQGHSTHGAFEDRVAHDGAGDADAADGDIADSFHTEAETLAGALQFGEISLAARTECEVPTD